MNEFSSAFMGTCMENPKKFIVLCNFVNQLLFSQKSSFKKASRNSNDTKLIQGCNEISKLPENPLLG